MVDSAITALHKQLSELEIQRSYEQTRKQVTVLFADVSGFTAMSETMDAEEQMVAALTGILRAARERNTGSLPVGEFLHRTDPETLRGWVGLEEAAA